MLLEGGSRAPWDFGSSRERAPVPRRRAPRRRSRESGRLRTALLVLVLLNASSILAAAVPAPLAAGSTPLPRTGQWPVRSVVASCTGLSMHLAADQCDAWGQLFDATNGPGWTGRGQGCSRADPCGDCTSTRITCSADGTSIIFMCVPPPHPPLSVPPRCRRRPCPAPPASCRAPRRVRAGTDAR
jgi:hypothetical protein